MTTTELTIDCQFPGGNIIVDAIEGDVISLHQDPRDTPFDWFYWYFQNRGAAGRTLEFRFAASDAIGVRGPAVSTDNGKYWTWLGQMPSRGRDSDSLFLTSRTRCTSPSPSLTWNPT